MNFKELRKNRHSVSDFGDESISNEDVMNAISLSLRNPSA